MYSLLPEKLKNYFTNLETEYLAYKDASQQPQIPAENIPARKSAVIKVKPLSYFSNSKINERFSLAVERLMFYPSLELEPE